MLLGGPVSCLISATVGVISLYAFDFVEPNNLSYSWWTWWIGDSIGVVIGAPLVLILIGQPRDIWIQRQSSVLLPLVFSLVVVILIFIQANKWEQARLQYDIRKQIDNIAFKIQSGLEAYTNVICDMKLHKYMLYAGFN